MPVQSFSTNWRQGCLIRVYTLALLYRLNCFPQEFELLVQHSGEQRQFAAQHPNHDPLSPLYWLVNHLSSQGIGLKQGEWVITGSYAGVVQVPS